MRSQRFFAILIAAIAALATVACTHDNPGVFAPESIRSLPRTRSLECTTPSCIRPLTGSEWNYASQSLGSSAARAIMNDDWMCLNIINEAQEYLDAAVVNEDPIWGAALTKYTGPTEFHPGYVIDGSIHIHEVIHRRQRLAETEAEWLSFNIYIADEADASYWQGRCA